MSDIDYPFIEDSQGRKLHYVLRLATDPANARTVFILHGQGFSMTPSGFKDSDWNVVCPLDRYGFDNAGSWFLGEKGDFFVKELMLSLINHIKRTTNSHRLYFWGSSMGGYAAILFGLLCGAEAVFANVPQIKLKNTEYTDDNLTIRKCMDAILSKDFPHWLDLTSLLCNTEKNKYPVFFITQTRFHAFNYLKEHIYYFIQKCDELEANYFLEIVPKTGHLMYRSVSDSIKYFDLYSEDIGNWVDKRKEYVNYKNDIFMASKKNHDGNCIEIKLSLISDDNVGDKDLLLSINPNFLGEKHPSHYGLALSPNPIIGLFKYIPTKPGKYDVSFEIPMDDYEDLEFSVKDFYPKGKTRVVNVTYKVFYKKS
ncbi:hypothetical protein ACOR62_07085 [Neisseria lisongii]|uniref:Alpha/beta hydrolase n=1 Tax=Neisseria lisongii TaxID=2912188 RepID=A0AAW5ALK1_9NEIS|nr:hypothetical protein [Neisseria lisongii]MCF7530044.1 hypothetical protein [Neisseria lisongii]